MQSPGTPICLIHGQFGLARPHIEKLVDLSAVIELVLLGLTKFNFQGLQEAFICGHEVQFTGLIA